MTPVTIRNPAIAPTIWRLLVTQALGASPALTRRLWRLFRATARPGEIGAIVRAQRRKDRQAMQDLLAVLTPRRLFALLATMSPEGAQPRDPEVVRMEQKILQRARGPDAWT